MPNQLAENNMRVTITMSKDLVDRIDKVARRSDRDRTYIIRHLIVNKFALIDGQPERSAPEIDQAMNCLY